ncbi:MAG: DNA replication and repair protein RecF [Patescibacteria group bacterium]
MIKSLKLEDFRNFDKKKLEFSDGITVIVGPNGVGKTNILEALHLLSTGKSFKAKVESEMLNYGADLARISGECRMQNVECIITNGTGNWPKKRLLINGVPKRLIDFAGNFKIVLFGPWDLDLVTDSPSLRRNFLDSVLSQSDREYRRAVLSYEKGLRQRNRLLFRIREEGINRSQLLFWNQLLIKNGNYITDKRQEFIEFVNAQGKCNLKYDPSQISEARLEQYKDAEIASATTLVGPHRDDFVFLQYDKDLASYGSRGQQRMETLWLKLAELKFIEETQLRQGSAGQGSPTLLLDDIFSELDHEHRDIVMEISTKQQTIITTADPHFIEKLKVGDIIKL